MTVSEFVKFARVSLPGLLADGIPVLVSKHSRNGLEYRMRTQAMSVRSLMSGLVKLPSVTILYEYIADSGIRMVCCLVQKSPDVYARLFLSESSNGIIEFAFVRLFDYYEDMIAYFSQELTDLERVPKGTFGQRRMTLETFLQTFLPV